MILEDDLQHIAYEYRRYFSQLSLIQAEKEILPSNKYIKLQTNEGAWLLISVSEKGWFVVGSGEYFETFEALMNTHSPGFRDTFATTLIGKLQNLAQQ